MPIVLVAAGCSSLAGNDDSDGAELLAVSRNQWELAAIDDYEFVVENRCFCMLGGRPVRVVVRDGSIVSLTVLSTGEPVEEQFAGAYRTIDGLFDVVRDARERDAYAMQVRYDDVYGYPDDVFIDYSDRMADEEFGWRITSFTRAVQH
jgi:hypothetical protein